MKARHAQSEVDCRTDLDQDHVQDQTASVEVGRASRPQGDASPPLREVAGTTASASWLLTGQSHENASTQSVTIKHDRFSVGRHQENDLCINNQSVSGKHAEFVFSGGEIYVRDLGSTNGTLLNGHMLRTLTKLRDGDILHFGGAMFTLQCRMGRVPSQTVATSTTEEAIAQVQFSKLITKPAIEPFYQPIVRMSDDVRVGYEVLSRSRLVGLETPAKMFRIAAQRTSEAELSTVCRSEALRSLPKLGSAMEYYLNTHPKEIGKPELLASLTQLREQFPGYSCVLEVHESAIASIDDLRELRRGLTDLQMGLAYDDFGSGQARLAELAEVPPDVVKFDIKLIRSLDTASSNRLATLEALVRMVTDLGVIPLAEGVETQSVAEICQQVGFLYAQGFLFGKPAPAAHWISSSDSASTTSR
ncbi:MAG: EAL domain-containing protein [Pirellulales bacterium]|nr:EAL domain-containing protein [Pirellulales bacterium]